MRSPHQMNALRLIAIALCCAMADAHATLQFNCPSQLPELQRQLPEYLQSLMIGSELYGLTLDSDSGVLSLALSTAPTDVLTLDFFTRPEFSLQTETVQLPGAKAKQQQVSTVSRKEIILALMQHGRVTEFKGEACSLRALEDHVGIRQNIVAWSENLNWIWPNGGRAKWNTRYWSRGTPRAGVSLHSAVMDAFLHQRKYTIGCYTATKLVLVQGMLDYYRRVKPDSKRLKRIEKALLADGEPLVDIEPGAMWRFETDFDPREIQQPGKLLNLHRNVAAGNFVPGDWVYLLNTDPASNQKTGYEGSNAIYMGHNNFDDYYNDHSHSYTYEQKLDEVYQWRNGVFNRSRDGHKVKALDAEALARMTSLPSAGGLQLDTRLVPRYF